MLKVSVYKVVVCDKCGGSLRMPDYGKITLIRELRRTGWAIGRKCLCPSCRETPQTYHTHAGV
jgi:hypothetical protein